jgi:hypothetical protein
MIGGQMIGGQMIGGQMIGGQMIGGQMIDEVRTWLNVWIKSEVEAVIGVDEEHRGT